MRLLRRAGYDYLNMVPTFACLRIAVLKFLDGDVASLSYVCLALHSL